MKKVNEVALNNSNFTFSSNAKLLMETAREKQIPVLELDPEYDLFQLGYGKYSILFRGLVTEKSSGVFSSFKNEEVITSLLDSLEFRVDKNVKARKEKEYKILVFNHQLISALEVGSKTKADRLSELNNGSQELIKDLTQIYNLDLAEISVSTNNIEASLEQQGQITAIDLNPDLSFYQEFVNLKKLSRKLINYYKPTKIPIVTVVGNNNEIIVRLLASILEKVGLRTGVVVNNVIHNNQMNFKKRNNLNLLLQNKETEIIVHGLTEQGLEEKELPYNISELLLITDLESEENLTFNNCLLGLNSNLIAVNVDKKSNLKLLQQSQEKEIIYCSLNSENIILQQQINSQQPAVYTSKNNLVLFDGVDKLPVISLDRLAAVTKEDPDIMSGILFAVAAAFVFEIPVFVTRSILESLTTTGLAKYNKADLNIN